MTDASENSPVGSPETPPAIAVAPGAETAPMAVSPHTGDSFRPSRRTATVGLVAALAVGALIGGVSGAGVTYLTTSRNGASATSSNAAPATITVNDSQNVTQITAVAAKASPSVVTIEVSASNSGGTGSGVILDTDGYILTNAHVVTLDGASADATIDVITADGHLLTAKLVGSDPISDLAVIKVDGATNLQPASFSDSSKLNVGDTAVAIGAPLGLAGTVTNGIVSALNRSITIASSAVPKDQANADPTTPAPNDPFNFWNFDTPGQQAPSAGSSSTISLAVVQTDAAINPGNSGGALLNSDGQVIGINVAIASAGNTGGGQSGSIGVGFAIPSNIAQRIAKELMTSGTATHGLLGASVTDVTAGDKSSSAVVGASISEVTRGGAADAAGLRAGDVITAVDGIPITGKTDLTAQVRALPAGASAKFSYVRNGGASTANAVLGTLG